MHKSLCLIGLIALAGCAGSSSAPPVAPSAGTSDVGGQSYTLNVPNMT